MKINGIGPSKIIDIYKSNKIRTTKSVDIEKSDSVQISKEARSISSMSVGSSDGSSSEKIEAIKNQIAQGTYKPNAKLTAQRMIDVIKGREV